MLTSPSNAGRRFHERMPFTLTADLGFDEIASKRTEATAPDLATTDVR